MAGQLLKLALLLISLTCSSSLNPTVTDTPENKSGSPEHLPNVTNNEPSFAELKDNTLLDPTVATTPENEKSTSEDLPNVNNNDPSFAALNDNTLLHPTVIATPESDIGTSKGLPNVTNNDPSFAALNDNTSSDKVTTTEEHMTSLASTKESKVSPEQETSPTGLVSQEDASTFPADFMTSRLATSKKPAPATVTPRPINEDDKSDHGMTSSTHPSGETVGIPEPVATQTPKNISSTTTKPKESEPTLEELSNKKSKTFILVVVLIVILLLIMVTAVVLLVRSKRRRGSQSFHSQSRSSKRQDVWAGQVPELGDGKMTQQPMGMENGTTVNKPESGKEQEMVTFISAEKMDDSVVEMNELGKDDVSEEKKPLLEDSSEVNEEPEKPPVEEQTPAPTVEQELV